MTPLLSICVPTYNRSHLLRLSLEAAVPQAAELRDKVEVLVSDNASIDDTLGVVEAAKSLGPVRYARNESNIGACANFIRAATDFARGEYVWILGDDDLLLPGGLARVVEMLRIRPCIDAMVVNFCYGRFPEEWPLDAIGGYRGVVRAICCEDQHDRVLREWKNIIRPGCLLWTHIYAHVVRRKIWTTYWSGRRLYEPPRSSFDVFPHNYMLADMVMDKPAQYLGAPVLVGFDGAQSWLGTALDVKTFMYSGVLLHYGRCGLNGQQFLDCERDVFEFVAQSLAAALEDTSRSALVDILWYLWCAPCGLAAWKSAAQAISIADRPRVLSRILTAAGVITRQFGGPSLWDRK